MTKKEWKRVYLEISNICNLSCSFCPQDDRIKSSLSLVEIEHILTKLCSYTDYLYLHVQGEPLLHPNLIAILDLCSKYHFHVQLVTNGTLLSNYNKKLFEHPALRKLSISLHSIDQHSIAIAAYLKPLITLKDYPLLYKELRFWNSQYLFESTRSIELLTELKNNFSIDTSKITYGRGQTIAPNYFLAFDQQFEWPKISNSSTDNSGTCHGVRDMIAILVDGTITACCLDHSGEISLGNIFTQEINEIIESHRYQKMKSGFQNNKITERLCQHCSYRLRFNKNNI